MQRAKDRAIDIVLKADNAEETLQMAKDKLNYFYEHLVFASLDLGVRKGRALDLGTQAGLCAIALAKQDYAFEITNFQDSVKAIAMGRKFAEREVVEEKIRWAAGKQESLPFADHSFDLVISGFDMHHWENPVEVFNEIARVLKTNGALLVGDLRRDAFTPVAPLLKAASYLTQKDRLYQELKHSFASAYLRSEIAGLVGESGLKGMGAQTSKDVQFVYVTREREGKKHVLVEIASP